MSAPPEGAEIIDLTHTDSEDEEHTDEENTGDSEGSEFEVTLGTETRTQLRKAIETISEDRLRELLLELIERHQAVEVALTQELVTVKPGTNEIIPRYETCANCDDEYDAHEGRSDDECVFHPGELTVEEDRFEDWDEDVHGPMDTSANRNQYPENFSWSCCNENGRSEGCVHGQHKMAVARKRQRIR